MTVSADALSRDSSGSEEKAKETNVRGAILISNSRNYRN